MFRLFGASACSRRGAILADVRLFVVAATLGVFAALWGAPAPAQAQFVQQAGPLTGTGSSGTAKQGYAVAIAADGNTAIVGGPSDNSSVGAAWVYVRAANGAWTQQGGKLVGTGFTGASQQGF